MVIIITGASRGLGWAMAEAFAADQQGHTLVLMARDAARLQQAAMQLQARFSQTTVLHYACQLGQQAQLPALQQWLQQHAPVADVLINNAGYFVPGSVHAEAEGNLEAMLEANLLSAYQLTRLVLPGMMSHGRGHVFNICSIASLKAYPGGGSYSISKFALYGFGQNLREEMKPHGIKVTNVMPGATWTDSWAGSGIPPERLMEAQDIASMVYACAHLSPQAVVEDIVMRPQPGDL
ncbi:MAG: SDR family oxidoreductase [Chitinophagaceae bacterium]|nr:SDR family oxidoreductase [Chitinophagaceae bacterium]